MKLGPNTMDLIFIGYARHSFAYKFLLSNQKFKVLITPPLWSLVQHSLKIYFL